MTGIVLTHPSALVGGSMWVAGKRVVDLPAPPDRPSIHLEAWPALVTAVGSDAACTLMQLVSRCQYDPTHGWVVVGSLTSIREWHSWGIVRARQARRELERVGVLQRDQLLRTGLDGRGGLGMAFMKLKPTSPAATSGMLSPALSRVEDERAHLPRALPGAGAWGDPLEEATIRALMSAWGFDGADAALSEYGTVMVSDAVKATAYRMLKGRVPNPGGYVRTVLVRGDIATPPTGLPPEWLTGDIDLVALVPAINPADALAAARAALDSRAASVMRRWQSLPADDKAALDAELEALLTTTALLTPPERQRREIDLREGLLAERGLLAELPES